MKNSLKFKHWTGRTYLFLVYVLTVFCFMACCECEDASNPDCPNYDPCHDVVAPKADFGAGYIEKLEGNADYNQFFSDTTVYLDGDTIPSTCTFYAYTTDVDSFYWQVGHDPRIFRGKSFFLKFGEEQHLQPIEVSLIVMKKSSCFEGGFVRDTLKRILVPDTKQIESPSWEYFNSTYRGVSTEFPKDTFDVVFQDRLPQTMVNMPKGHFGRPNFYSRDYDEVHFQGQQAELLWIGNARFQPDNRRKVVIRYKVSYDLGKTAHWHTYVGYRLD